MAQERGSFSLTVTALAAPVDYGLYAAMTIAIVVGAVGGTIYYRMQLRRSRGR